MKVYRGLDDLIGDTPLFELATLKKQAGFKANIFAKVEFFNPAGSIKDRVAKFMLNEAEVDGKLLPGGTVIEPTSGNTGIGLAALCVSRGYRCIIVMPDNMSDERKKLIKAYGAELVLTPGSEGMKAAIEKAEEIHCQIPGSMIAGQFENYANPMAHEKSTGPEIYNTLRGCVDVFVASAGTGGTVSGTGRYLKGKCSSIKVYAAEPLESNVINGGRAGAHGIQGIGAGFIPQTLALSVLDGTLDISTERAKDAARMLAKTEGLLIGISGGCNLAAAIELANRPEFEGKNIVTVFPDSGDRYLSTDLFGD